MSTEASDSLRSKATLTLLDLLGEGRIGGLVDGDKSVFLNDTPLQNADGTYNFNGVSSAYTWGHNNQGVLPGFGNYVETPYNASIQIKKNSPYTFTVSNPMADSVRAIVTFPSLTYTDSGTGNISGTTVQYKFQMSLNGGVFTDVPIVPIAITGTWAVESGQQTATVVGNTQQMSATIQAASTNFAGGWIDVQAQEYNGSAWVNLGGVKRLTIKYLMMYQGGEDLTLTNVSDSYTVQSKYSKVRFLPNGSYVPGGTFETGAITSGSVSPIITVSGKSRSKYQRKHIISIPRPANSVQIRMVRLTDDSTSSFLTNDTYLDSYYEIISLNMTYPNSALYGFRVDSQQFSQIPTRSYLVDGLYIQVPTNYDPVTRAYTGVWDGTFKMAVSNNPAWVMYDLLTNKRYGLGTYLTTSQIDKAMLYTIGKYCDEMVPDGFGSTEPRFTLNTVISSRGDAYKVISDIASVFRGMTYWAGGMACFTQDGPTDPTMLYSRANVIDGAFSYTGSARKDRHSVVYVTYNDPKTNYKQKVEYVEDTELLAMYGVRKLDTLAFGCSSRGQAARVGRWILYTEKYESDFISFKVGIDSAFVAPGNVIKIQDPNRAGKRAGGRLVSCTSNSATLDAATTIAAGGILSIMMPDGTFVDRTVQQSPGAHTTFTWSVPLSTLPQDNALWLMQDSQILPILARVVSVSQSSATEFEITAIEHNPSKYAAIEQGLTLADRPTSIIDPTFVEQPTDLQVAESIYLAAPGVVANKMLISWFGNSTQYELTYQLLSATTPTNAVKVRVQDALTYEVPSVELGTYQVTIVGINPLGKRSNAVTTTYTVIGKQSPPSSVTTIQATPSASGVLIQWSSIADIDLKAYELRQCATVGQVWSSAARVNQTTSTTSYTVPLTTAGTYEWIVRALNLTGYYSATDARVTLTIANPNTPVISANLINGICKLTWASAQTSLPIDNYEVRVGSSWATGTTVGRVTAETFSIPVTWGSTQTFWIMATDVGGNKGSAGSVNASVSNPVLNNLAVAIVADRYRLTWTGVETSLPINEYEIRIGDSSSTWSTATVLADISASSYEAKIDWAGVKKLYVAAIDSAGNVGSAQSVSLNIAAPGTPTMTATVSGTNVTLAWATPALGSLALTGYEVRQGTGTFASALLVSTLAGNSITLPITWLGDQTFQIVAKDLIGNASTVSTKVVSVSAPAAPTPAGSFLADTFNLTWTAPASTLPIAEYEVRYGSTSSTWASSAATAIRIKATLFSISAQWSGVRNWFVAGIDANGNYGAVGSVSVNINTPSAPVMTRKVVDNNVLLYWSDSVATLPVNSYELRRGDTFSTATVIGKKSGGFTTVFETASGTYTYWLVGIDTAGNYGTPTSLAVTVDQPPDYVLKYNYDTDFSGTKSNMALDVDNSYVMPVNTTETFAQHFSTRSWTSPDSQIAAGYPVFIEPANSPGYYEETIDYGTVLASTRITVTISGSVVAGSPTRATTISVRKTTSDPWIDYATDAIYVGDFRYVKIRFTVSGGGTDLYRLNGINVKLDSKIRNDAGMGVAGASDLVSGTTAVINGVTVTGANPANSSGIKVPDGDGTLVLFNVPLIDVMSLDVTVGAGSTARYGIYDFNDIANPTGFKVLLFNAAGTRVGGSFSWSARGI